MHKLKRLIFMGMLLPLMAVSSVSALSPEQKRIYDSNIGYFDLAETLGSTCNTSSSLVGAENEDKIYNFLVSQGFQPYQAAGIMGNMQAESHFESRLVEYKWKNSRGEVSDPKKPETTLDDNVPPDQGPHGEPGYGIVQFTDPKQKQALRDRTAAAGLKGSDLQTQLQLLMDVLGAGKSPTLLDALKGTKNVDEASDLFFSKYERPKDQSEAKKEDRRKNGRAILAKHGSDTGAGTGSGEVVACSNGSGEVVGGYSLPLDRHWYDENPQMFAEPHHDYPASDLQVPIGTNVYSMTDGTVVTAPVGGDCGVGIAIETAGGVTFKYCHGSDGGAVPSAKQGDKVTAGQLIMHSDTKGESTGPHLHVEIKAEDQLRCPQTLFKSIVDGNPLDPKTLPTSGCTK